MYSHKKRMNKASNQILVSRVVERTLCLLQSDLNVEQQDHIHSMDGMLNSASVAKACTELNEADIEKTTDQLQLLKDDFRRLALLYILVQWTARGYIHEARALAKLFPLEVDCLCQEETSINRISVLIGLRDGILSRKFQRLVAGTDDSDNAACMMALAFISLAEGHVAVALVYFQQMLKNNAGHPLPLQRMIKFLDTAEWGNRRSLIIRILPHIEQSVRQEQHPVFVLLMAELLLKNGFKKRAGQYLCQIDSSLLTVSQKRKRFVLICQTGDYNTFLNEVGLADSLVWKDWSLGILYRSFALSLSGRELLLHRDKMEKNSDDLSVVAMGWSLFSCGKTGEAYECLLTQTEEHDVTPSLSVLWYYAALFARNALDFATAARSFNVALELSEQLVVKGDAIRLNWCYGLDYAILLLVMNREREACQILRGMEQAEQEISNPCALILNWVQRKKPQRRRESIRLAVSLERAAKTSYRPWLSHSLYLSILSLSIYQSLEHQSSIRRLLTVIADELHCVCSESDSLAETLKIMTASSIQSSFLSVWIDNIFNE